MLELQQDLSYKEQPVRILGETERRTRQKVTKFLKVQWANHSEDEATWEREDHLRAEYPQAFFFYFLILGMRILVSRGEL